MVDKEDIESHKYGYNAKIIKPEELIKQLVHKTQECEELKEKYEALKLENQEGYEIVAELKHECEELKKQLETSEKWRIESDLQNARYRRALEEIERYLKLPTNVCLTDCSEYSIGQSCSQNCFHNRLKLLLDIINKTKGKE